MALFQRKPKVVEAFVWEGTSQIDADIFTTNNGFPRFVYGEFKGRTGLIIEEGGNKEVVEKGHYIVKHPNGAHYCVNKRFFELKYQPK